MKLTPIALAFFALMLAACGAASGGAQNAPDPEAEPSDPDDAAIPTIEFDPNATPVPTATPESDRVIGRATIDYYHDVAHTFPSGSQRFQEDAQIPIEVVLRSTASAREYLVRGTGLLTWVLDVNVPNQTGCVAKFATTARATVTGKFNPDPLCTVEVTITFNFEQPQMVTGEGFCEPPTIDPATFDVQLYSDFVTDAELRSLQQGPPVWDMETIALKTPEIDYDETGCRVTPGS